MVKPVGKTTGQAAHSTHKKPSEGMQKTAQKVNREAKNLWKYEEASTNFLRGRVSPPRK